MNALDRKFMNAAKSTIAARLLGVASAAALLAGCASPVASAKVDPSSPIAADVAKLATADKDYPSFNEIPPTPTDVRPAAVYGQRARAVEAARADLDAATTPGTWTLGGTSGFASRAQAEAGPAIGASSSAATEAFAKSARKRATPPPPAKH
jgi:outer membrane murein-binding lipoprotein Lpp